MEVISVPMNAARVCNAIARIGYEPFSALMDLIDNSVSADASTVTIQLKLVDGKTIKQRNNVFLYRIIDDGKGMDTVSILNAFKLGSDANYGKNSLSKYGMGLKSAGFSLGTCIKIVSKQNDILSDKYTLDRIKIEESNDYVICREELDDSEIDIYGTILKDYLSGTIVEITGCGEIYHTSAHTTIDKLKHRLGITYYPFLYSNGLNIFLDVPGESSQKISPVDILFSEDSIPFDPTTYDGSKPCCAFKQDWQVQPPGEASVSAVKLEAVTFPQDGMGGQSSPLLQPERDRVKSYKVSRDNKGFFIYRNGRLIRWGDDLGMIGKDQYGFRARIELTTEHDDLLHVDVSKQRLEMDDETRNNLELLMRLPRRQANQVFEICRDLLFKGVGEGTGFTDTADAVPEEDPCEDVTPPDPKVKKERATKKEEETKDLLDKISVDENDSEQPDEECFTRVRYADNLNTMNLWSTQKDAIQGTFIIINRRHPFYQSILSSFGEASPERLAIEAIIYCCAVGENKTYENLTAVSEDNIRKVFERLFYVLSFNLGGWASGNQHIFEKI